jgi:cellulase/cellobiase CelA1
VFQKNYGGVNMKIKRFFSLFMVGTMLTTTVPITAFADNTVNIDNMVENNITVNDVTVSDSAISVLSKDISADFKVQCKWNNGFNGEITITNLTDKVIENWQIEMSFPHEIVNIWNAQIISYEDGIYNIKNAGGNNNVNISAHGSVTFGFIGTYDEIITEPKNVQLVGG